jgi:catecholate siderophore receptor
MLFGRGGGGGLINRVTKEAGFTPVREITLQAAPSATSARPWMSTNRSTRNRLPFQRRLDEDSDSFRKFVNLKRDAVNPTLTFAPSPQTKVTLGYEYLHDSRTADRGITSFQGRPVDVPISTYYGNPDDSHVRADVDLVSAAIEHEAGALTIRNRTLFGDYDRGYQNYVPGAVNAAQTQVTLTAYNNATKRRNLFNQTDLTYGAKFPAGSISHTLLTRRRTGQPAHR